MKGAKRGWAVACVAVWQAAALGQDARAKKDAPNEQPSKEQAPLSGPKVPNRATLVRTDMQGKFQRLEVRPEEAALEVMQVDPGRLDQARAAIEARNAALRKHLIDHITLVKEWADERDGGESGKGGGIERLMQELYDRFDPQHLRDPLLVPLAKALDGDEHAELTRLVEEYWRAAIDAEQGKRPNSVRPEIEKRQLFGLFQREVRKAYDATLRPFRQKLENVYAAVDPTPEQRVALRNAVIAYIQESRLTPNQELRLKLARAIYDALDEERRVKLLSAGLTAM